MKKLFYLFFLILQSASAQIVQDCTAPYDNATALVSVLVNGVTFSNATLSTTSEDCNAGYFDGSQANIGLDAGIAMATGGLPSIVPGFTGFPPTVSGIDNDLSEQLQMVNSTSTSLNNLVVLEFDFVPNSDEISFNYVFASVEYESYACSEFNDIFGFFLSGPGINGPFENNAINIALVPDPNSPDEFTQTPVVINTINAGVAGVSGNPETCTAIDADWQDYSVFYVEHSNQDSVNFPGFTVPLQATATVIPCEEYHIKLAIADVSDGALNSAVFLGENSFNSVGVVVEQESEYVFVDNDTTLVEGCFNGSIEIELSQPLNTNYFVDYEVSGTATNGVDYADIGSQIAIPAGLTSASIPIIPYYDGLVEGTESIIVTTTISDGCVGEERDFIFNIVDRLELFLDLPTDTAFCPGDDAITIAPYLSGGIFPLNYEWYYNGGMYSNQEEITILPSNLGTYTFNAFDVCDSEVSGEIEAYLLEPEDPLSIYTSYTDIEVCTDDDLSTEVFLIGGIGEYNIEWSLDGVVYSDSLNFIVPTELPFEYDFELEVKDECSNEVTRDFSIDVMDCFVPNVFTPNGDGIHDYWYVNFGDVIDNVRVKIFNRWGQLVFQSIHYELCDESSGNHCWDGVNMSTKEPCLDGVYYYTIELPDGREDKGSFSLLR